MFDGQIPRLIRRYVRGDEGSLTIFSLFIIIVMLVIGGIANDIIVFEAERKRKQATLDQAIVAATNLRQREDSEDVIRSFMEKQGFDPDTVTVDIDEERVSDGDRVLSRTISATTSVQTDTVFMRMAGVDTLNGTMGSAANEAVQNVEISLVLDISGSMRFDENGKFIPGKYNRIAALRDAVDQFVNVVLDVRCDANGLNCVQNPDSFGTTINVIPYAGHVNPGPGLFAYMNGSRWHNWSSCMEVTDDDFTRTGLPNGSSAQVAHFMKWGIEPTNMEWGWCPQDNAGILVASNDAEQIKNYVRNIALHDGTATHVGLKYGVALLDPTSRDAVKFLADRGEVAEDYRDRPANYTDDVTKYLVVMTDGGTTDSWRPNTFKTTLKADDGSTSTVEGTFSYDDVYSSSLTPEEWEAFQSTGAKPSNPSDAWKKIMSRFGSRDPEGTLQDAADVEQGYPNTKQYDDGTVVHSRNTNNANIAEICTLAKAPITMPDGSEKANRITVYSIAFLTSDGPANLMAGCSNTTEQPYFWRVRDANSGLATAFRSIAFSINKLRLTQ